MKTSLVPIKDPKNLGALIRQTRKQMGMTQAQAAALCNIGTRFLSDLENGKPTLQLGKVLQVLKAFGWVAGVKKKEMSDE